MNKLLIVEDNSIARKTAKSMFGRHTNAEILTAENGEEALEISKETDLTVIIMDIGLGDGMDGAETTNEIRKVEIELKRTRCPVYALTAHCEDKDLIRNKEMGIDKTYKKPVTAEIINQILDDIPNLKK